jgi:hypothetical protein
MSAHVVSDIQTQAEGSDRCPIQHGQECSKWLVICLDDSNNCIIKQFKMNE